MASPAAPIRKQNSFSLVARLGELLSGGGAGTGDSTIPLIDDDYVVYEPWVARGIDLLSKSGRKYLVDASGHPAAVMHGWLTKRNKSGIASGKVDKDRYFVLTPQTLAFFTDDRVANVSPEGYMLGSAEGERTGFLGRTGGALSLESVCEVRPILLNGEADDDADVGAEGGSKKARGGASADGDDGTSHPVGDAQLLSTLLKVDFGDYALVCNAHNQPCRMSWVHALRKWSAWRKRTLDQAMLAHFGNS
jgi:hypothetical protein